MRWLVVDNHDSYTHNLVQLLAVATGTDPVVVSDDDVAPGELDLAGFAGVVISPGPGHPANPRDFALSADVLRRSEVPVLGVCLGMQGIALAAGAAVEAAPQPRHGHVDRVRHTGTSLLAGLPQGFAATRYHSFRVAEPLPAQLEPLAWAADGVLMALRHRTRPQVGVQFHPESVASTTGARIVEDFVRWCGGAPPAAAGRPAAPDPSASGRAASGRAASGRAASAGPAPRYRVLAERTGPAVDTEAAFTHLFGASAPAFWLDSAARGAGSGRFSFLGDGSGPLARELPAGPGVLDRLAAELERSGVEGADALPFAFAGGFVGWAGYELRAECGYPTERRDDLPAAAWLFCDRFVAVDHERDATWVVALVERDGPRRQPQERAAREWSQRTARSLRRLPPPPPPPAPPALPAVLDTPPQRYREQVLAAQEQLRAGESYEVCLTTQARVAAVGDPLDAYRRLRRSNPAPYAAFLRLGGAVVAGSSPERFLHVDTAGNVETRPIKGTAALDTDPLALRSDAKTRAENLMVVDLLRHDLGRVCAPGTVVVPDLMAVETLPTVHQLVTTVRGRLRPEAGAVDCLRSCFPPGSMTGAPKLRTTEIVDALEQRPRGVYSGTLGWLSTTGAADLAVVIRTAVLVPGAAGDAAGDGGDGGDGSGGQWRVGAGGAVVLDSDPDAEVAEVLLKLRAPLAALTSEPLSP